MSQFKPLTNEELSKVVPILEKLLLSTNESAKLYSTDIVRNMIVLLAFQKINYNFTQVTLRKMINYLRSTGRLPIMATSQGYWVSYKLEDMTAQIESLESRANSIMLASYGLRNIIKKVSGK